MSINDIACKLRVLARQAEHATTDADVQALGVELDIVRSDLFRFAFGEDDLLLACRDPDSERGVRVLVA